MNDSYEEITFNTFTYIIGGNRSEEFSQIELVTICTDFILDSFIDDSTLSVIVNGHSFEIYKRYDEWFLVIKLPQLNEDTLYYRCNMFDGLKEYLNSI